MKFKAKEYRTLEEGCYPALLENIEEREGSTGRYCRWVFAAQSPQGDPIPVAGLTSLRSGPKAKGRQWVEAILGSKMKAGEEIDLDELVGKPCRVQVTVVDLEDGGRFNRVEKVLPSK